MSQLRKGRGPVSAGMARFLILFGTTCLLTRSAGAQAEEQSLSLEAAQSTLSFHATNTFDTFDGVASQLTGSVILDDGRPRGGRVQFPVSALKTGVDGRDRNMNEPRFLDGTRFTSISFELDGLDGPAVAEGREGQGTLRGKLRIKSVLLPIEVPVTFGRQGAMLHVGGTFSLDIRQLGMEPPVVAIIQRMNPVLRITFRLVFGPLTH